MFKKILMLLSCSFLTTSIPGTLRAMHDATIYDAFGNIFEQIYPELIIGSKDIQTTKAETPQGKITSSEIFGYLERGIPQADQLPTEIKYAIEGNCPGADTKTDHLFKNFKVRPLDQFISPGAQYIKASFVEPDKLMLIMGKRGNSALDSHLKNFKRHHHSSPRIE